MRKYKIQKDIWGTATLICLVLFAVFLLYPILQIFRQSVIGGDGEFTFAYFIKFFSKRYYLNALLNSLKVSLCATVLAVILGTLLAYLMHSIKIVGRGLVEILIIITMLSPPFIGAYSWILLLGRSGAITTFVKDVFGIQMPAIYGFPGMLMVFTTQMYSLVYLYVSGALKNLDRSMLEASECFGCIGIRRVLKVVVPLIGPTMLSAGLLVFMRSMADFGTPQLIGEGYRTMPYLIYNEFISEVGGNSGFAAALSVLMVLLTTVLFLGQKMAARKFSYSMSAVNPIEPQTLRGWKAAAVHLMVYVPVFIGLLPQITVTYTAFQNTNGVRFVEGYSLNSFSKALSKLSSSVGNTLLYSLIAVLIIVVLGTLIAYLTVRRHTTAVSILDSLTMMPYIIPGSVMGIALLLGFSSKPIKLMGTAAIIILAYILRRMPYTIRSASAILMNIHPSVEEASMSLGASKLKTFVKITAPMMRNGVISGAILSWMTIISELSASVLLYVTKTQTLTIAIYTEVVRGNYGTAAALSVMLTTVTVLVLMIFFKVSGKREMSL
ncbi:iron ABC transporter permease [Oscillospiraceae bacterium 44-34]